jgi:polyhydroxybutyrate depolymerase
MISVHRLVASFLVFVMLTWTAPASALPAGRGVARSGEFMAEVPGTQRSVLLYKPSRLSADRPAPLLVLLHGSGGTGRAILDQSRLVETAERNGFIIAAPDGGIKLANGFVWNIPGVPAISGRMPTAGDADDVAFIGQSVDWLVREHCADASRVYATGISGGGRMASWLACVDADRFAAIAPVVGLRAGNPRFGDPAHPDPATCHPSHPMPIIAFAGDADTTNPIAGGGAAYWQYSMRAAEERWAELNGCRATTPPSGPAKGVYSEGFTRCREGADVVARVTVGGRHEWVADNNLLWAFLAAHRRKP